MAQSTGIMLAVTGVSFGNQWLGNGKVEIPILIAGGIATVLLGVSEQIPGFAPIAVGVAWIALFGVLVTGYGGGASPIENLNKLTGT